MLASLQVALDISKSLTEYQIKSLPGHSVQLSVTEVWEIFSLNFKSFIRCVIDVCVFCFPFCVLYVFFLDTSLSFMEYTLWRLIWKKFHQSPITKICLHLHGAVHVKTQGELFIMTERGKQPRCSWTQTEYPGIRTYSDQKGFRADNTNMADCSTYAGAAWVRWCESVPGRACCTSPRRKQADLCDRLEVFLFCF